jgi:hypothetical protein
MSKDNSLIYIYIALEYKAGPAGKKIQTVIICSRTAQETTGVHF